MGTSTSSSGDGISVLLDPVHELVVVVVSDELTSVGVGLDPVLSGGEAERR